MKLLLTVVVLALFVQDDKPKTGSFKKKSGTSYYVLDVPKNYKSSKPHGLIIMLHGAGGRPELYAAAYKAATKKGFIVLLPAARPKTPAEARVTTFDEKDTTQILKMITEVRETYAIDPDRILLSGHSAGAAYAFWLVGQNPDLFTACAAGASGLRFDVGEMKGAEHVPFYIVCGKKDPFHVEAKASVKPMRDAGFEVQFEDPAAWGHALPRQAWAKMFDWFRKLCPDDQAKLLQKARAHVKKREYDEAEAALKKLRALKKVTDYAKTRADRIAAEIKK